MDLGEILAPKLSEPKNGRWTRERERERERVENQVA